MVRWYCPECRKFPDRVVEVLDGVLEVCDWVDDGKGGYWTSENHDVDTANAIRQEVQCFDCSSEVEEREYAR